MHRKKIAILIVSLVIAALAVLSVPTLSYIVSKGSATNVITTGGLKLKLNEKMADGTDFPKEGVAVMPGDTVSKIVTVENVGTHPMYVRIQLVKGVNDETLDAEKCISVNANDTDWTFVGGYYYYNKELKAGEETVPLFTEAQFSGLGITNEFIGKTITLDVMVSAVQSENNGSSVFSAIGWKEN